MKLLKEFKDFAIKGNMMDMAIGIIIGASFNAIVNVLVKNIILPREASSEAAQVSIDYGLLIETVLDFLIVGFTIFIVVKFINKLKNQANDVEDQTVPTPVDIELLSKIKELLEEQNKALIKK